MAGAPYAHSELYTCKFAQIGFMGFDVLVDYVLEVSETQSLQMFLVCGPHIDLTTRSNYDTRGGNAAAVHFLPPLAASAAASRCLCSFRVQVGLRGTSTTVPPGRTQTEMVRRFVSCCVPSSAERHALGH